MKNDRLFQILYLLLEQQTCTAPQLAEKLEVSVRTIYRDIDALCRSGVPVTCRAGKGGGVAVMPGFTLNKTLLSEDEQNQILFAVQSLQVAGGETQALAQKLSAVFQKTDTNWIEVDFSRWGYAHTDTVRFDLLRQGILQKELLRLRYCGASGETTQRDIEPMRLVFKDKAWYLQAFCRKAGDFRTFKISRIETLAATGEHFCPRPGPLPPVETQTFGPCGLVEVSLLFDAGVAYRVLDDFEHDSITRQPDGTLLVQTEIPRGEWATSYLLSFGPAVRILSPASLQCEVRQIAENISFHHKT